MQFDKTTGRWAVLGAADEVRKSDNWKKIKELLENSDEGYTPKELTSLTDLDGATVRQTLGRMVEQGVAQKPERGRYAISR
jgi:Fic family protein